MKSREVGLIRPIVVFRESPRLPLHMSLGQSVLHFSTLDELHSAMTAGIAPCVIHSADIETLSVALFSPTERMLSFVGR